MNALFDPSRFPMIPTKKSLVVVDPLTIFLSTKGILTVKNSQQLVERLSRLITTFRLIGDIIWAYTNNIPQEKRAKSTFKFPDTRLVDNNEAYLDRKDIESEYTFSVDPTLRKLAKPFDTVIIKETYSAFAGTNLLNHLRRSMNTKLYIVGSLLNVNVLATAVDAAPLGGEIFVIEDCCGFRNDTRKDLAINYLETIYACCVSTSEKLNLATGPMSTYEDRRTSMPATFGNETDETDDSLTSVFTKLNIESHTTVETEQNTPALDDSSTRLSIEDVPVKGSSIKTPSIFASESNEHLRDEISLEKKIGQTCVEGPTERDQNMDHQASNLVINKCDKEVSVDDTRYRSIESNEHLGQFGLCEGDTAVLYNVLEDEFAIEAFKQIRSEVQWHTMHHRSGTVPRLVAVQGEVNLDGSKPVYRHPADESPSLLPFSPTVSKVKRFVELKLGHQVNHVLIQLYRDGFDYISEHSDKTIDVSHVSYIGNLSLGAERTMVFRTKKDSPRNNSVSAKCGRLTEKATLPHNSLCRMGLYTNRHWLHSIKQDRRAKRDKPSNTLAFDGVRISLTFRLIRTFLDADETVIWGQGATSKRKEDAKSVINGNEKASENLLRAFGAENQESRFDWSEWYGDGFDVLHMNLATPSRAPISSDNT